MTRIFADGAKRTPLKHSTFLNSLVNILIKISIQLLFIACVNRFYFVLIVIIIKSNRKHKLVVNHIKQLQNNRQDNASQGNNQCDEGIIVGMVIDQQRIIIGLQQAPRCSVYPMLCITCITCGLWLNAIDFSRSCALYYFR